MAITLAEAEKLSNDVLLQGVIETIIKEDPLLEFLPFIFMVGNALTYNQENVAAAADFYAVGDTWVESTPTFTQLTANLKILGGDADTDNFLKKTRGNIQDLEAAIVDLKSKAVAHKLGDTLITGDAAVDTKSYDGLDKLIPAAQEVFANGAIAGNGASLTLERMDTVIDAVLGDKPDILLMSKRSRRKLNGLFRASGSGVLPTQHTEFGRFVDLYDGVPVLVSDWILNTKTVGTSTDCSVIYAVKLGEGAFAGLTAIESIIDIERVGNLEQKDASRVRVKAYVSCALFNSKKAAKLTGVRD